MSSTFNIRPKWYKLLSRSEHIQMSLFQQAKEKRIHRLNLKRSLKDAALIIVGVLSAAFGLKAFLIPNHLIDGGATGIALLLTQKTQLSISWLIVLVNLPFILLAYRTIGFNFARKALIISILLAITVAVVHFPAITKDPTLISVFGGFFLGAGMGLAVRAGTVLDGTEILAINLSRRLQMSIGDVVMGTNILIFSLAAYWLSIDLAMYSLLTYLSASKTLDFIVEGIDEYVGVTIIAAKCETVKDMITKELGRGVTVYSGKRGVGKRGEIQNVEILYTVITRLELHKLNAEMEKIDPNAFIVMNNVKDLKGGLVKQRPNKHHTS